MENVTLDGTVQPVVYGVCFFLVRACHISNANPSICLAVYTTRHSVVTNHCLRRAVNTIWGVCCDLCNRKICAQGRTRSSVCQGAEPCIPQDDHGDAWLRIRGMELPSPHLAHLN